MNWIELTLVIFIIASVILTIFTEPALSLQYWKSVGKSSIVMVKKGVSIGTGIVKGFTGKNETVEKGK